MSFRFGRISTRLGWLATTLALAVALVVGAWTNYRGAKAAVVTLNRGQADLLDAAVREVVHPRDYADTAALQALLDTHAEVGLRYVAVLDANGRVLASAGEPIADPAPTPPQGVRLGGVSPLVELDERVRVFIPRPVRDSRERREPPDAAADSAEPQRRGIPPASAFNVIEFEPVIASGLVNRAARSLVLSAIGATILTLAAVLFWRTSERWERARLHLEEQKRLSVLGEMSAVLAHEIRNPLASLKGHAQLLAERIPAESRERARADRVIGEAARLEALTSDLLDFARSAPLAVTDADPADVARTSIADVAPDGFEIDVAAAPARWALDPGRIRQALVNVLQNARQASPEDRPPHVRVAREDHDLVFEVRDFGPGLPAGAGARIFDPFFTTRTNGTGLGLAVARRIAEMHGGAIVAYDHPEGGAVFRMTIPQSQR